MHRSRSPGTRFALPAAALAGVLAAALPAAADRVYLKNGNTIVGKVTETEAAYIVDMPGGSVTARKEKVLRVEWDPTLPKLDREAKAPPAEPAAPATPAQPPPAEPAAPPATPSVPASADPAPPKAPAPPAAGTPLEALFVRYFETKDLLAPQLTEALIQIGPAAMAPSVARARANPQNVWFASAILKYMEAISSPDRAEHLASMARPPLAHPIRMDAMKSLGRVNDEDAARQLVRLLEEDEKAELSPSNASALESLTAPPAKRAAARALARLLERGGKTHWMPFAASAYVAVANPPDVGLLKELARSSIPEVRSAALIGLGKTGDHGALPLLADALRSQDQKILRAGLYAAGRLRVWDLAPRMIELLETDWTGPDTRAAVADALRTITNQAYGDSAEIWKAWWKDNGSKLVDDNGEVARDLDGNAEERIKALRFIGENRCERWLEAVLARLHTGEAAVRAEAARAAGRIQSPRAVPDLLNALTDNALREPAVTALGQILGVSLGNDPDAWTLWWKSLPEQNNGKPDGLVKLLEDASAKLRQAAVRQLGALALTETEPDLARALKDSDPAVAAEACKALGNLRMLGSAPALIDALLHPDASVQSSAVASLRVITGQGFTTYDEWSDWRKKSELR